MILEKSANEREWTKRIEWMHEWRNEMFPSVEWQRYVWKTNIYIHIIWYMYEYYSVFNIIYIFTT